MNDDSAAAVSAATDPMLDLSEMIILHVLDLIRLAHAAAAYNAAWKTVHIPSCNSEGHSPAGRMLLSHL